MPFNSLAIYGHRGWGSSSIVSALAASGAPLRVLYLERSDVSMLPSHFQTFKLDHDDLGSIVKALDGIDVLISLVGHEGVPRQHDLLKAIKLSPSVELFSPSGLDAMYDEQGMGIPVNKAKNDVEVAAREMGIDTTVVRIGNFAEFAVGSVGMGVDLKNNQLVCHGNTLNEHVNLCTREYVASAYVHIFATSDISKVVNRNISLCELSPTGTEIAQAMEKLHRSPPKIINKSLDDLDPIIASNTPLGMAPYCRKIWWSGKVLGMMGNDWWDVEGFEKRGLEELVVGDKMGAFRELPEEWVMRVREVLDRG